jgi:uncharacterized lipoprotein YmbA
MRRRVVLALAWALPLAACTSSPNPSYFTLSTIPGTPSGRAPARIALRRIEVAQYLDRNSIVRARIGTQVEIAGSDLWAEPLGSMLNRVLADELTQRLPGSTVYSTTGAITAAPLATVEINIQRLDADASGLVHLLAQVAIERGDGYAPLATRTFDFTARPTGPGVGQLVAAMSEAVAQLADTVAKLLRR